MAYRIFSHELVILVHVHNYVGNLSGVLSLSTDDIQSWFEKFRSELNMPKVLDFDDPYCLRDTDYYNITGLTKGSYFQLQI
jgi:hypothetical protein